MDDSLLDIHQLITHSKPKRKWRVSYLAICCLRGFASSSSSSKEEISTPLIDDELTITRSKSKWRTAYQTIYCARAFISLSNSDPPHKPRPSSIDVVDGPSLTRLVRNKDLDQLSMSAGIEDLASSLKSNVEHSIEADPEDIRNQQEAFGPNTFPKPPTKHFFHFVYEALIDPVILILLGCASLSLGFEIKQNGMRQGWYDGGSILVVVFLPISFSVIINFRQSRQFDKLAEVSNNIQVEIVRGGRPQRVSVFKSIITGESDYVQVDHDSTPSILSGNKVVDGCTTMLITSVGMNTSSGEMMSMISYNYIEPTPLQKRLNKLTLSKLKVGLSLAFLILVMLSVRYFTGHTKDKNGNTEFHGRKTKVDDVINAIVGIIAAAVSILGVTIPVGLPFAVTLTLAYSMKRMMADQAMVVAPNRSKTEHDTNLEDLTKFKGIPD